MKTLIALIAFASSTAWAQIKIDQVLPRLAKKSAVMNQISLPFKISLSKVVYKIDQVDQEIRAIELDNNGLVKVISRTTGQSIVFKLSDLNQAEILPAVEYVGEAELETLHFSAVCEMMDDPNSVQIIYAYDKVLNRLEMIFSPRGCMYESRVQPKYQGQQDLALELNTKLITLAYQYYK